MNSWGSTAVLNSIEFFISEGWTGFKRSGIMSFVAVGTVIVSLTIFGVFLMGIVNIGSIIGTISSNVQVSAYADRSLEKYEVDSIVKRMSALRGVSSVKYLSKADAWKNFKEEYGEGMNLEEVMSDNPLPDTFIVEVQIPELVQAVAKQISGMPSISEVRYSGKLIEQVKSLASAVRLGGLILVCMLSVATLLIVINTIRLTVIAREKDISIMKLVGATDTFIKWPFIVEGVIIGMIGSMFSFAILKASYDLVIFQVNQALPFLPLVSDQKHLVAVYLIVGCVGMFLGMLGGYISVSKSLKEFD
ncbi:MAG: permease-like cell division protein FtsX [bacterium]